MHSFWRPAAWHEKSEDPHGRPPCWSLHFARPPVRGGLGLPGHFRLAVVLSGKRTVARPALPCLDQRPGAAVRVHVLSGGHCPAPVVVPVTVPRRRHVLRRRWRGTGSYSGPLTASSSQLDNILPSPVQTAPLALQSVVTGRTTLIPAFPSGSTVISQRMLPGLSSRCAFVTAPPVTVRRRR